MKGKWVVFEYEGIWVAEAIDVYGDIMAMLRFENESAANRFVAGQGEE